MKKQLLYNFLLLLFLLPAKLFAQDITGVWTGLLYVDSTKQYLPYDIVISEEKGKYSGFTRIVFAHDGKTETGIRDVSIKKIGEKVIIEDDEFIESNFSIYVPKRIKKTMELTLSENDTAMQLNGKWSTPRTRVFLPASGTGSFTKKIDYKTTEIYKRLDTLKRTAKLSFTQPKLDEPAIAVVPKEIKALPAPPVTPAADPDLIIPPIDNDVAIQPLPINKNKNASIAKITAVSRQKKLQMDAISKTVIKYTPKVVAPPAPKPEPTVAVTQGKPEKKPVLIKEEKPAVVAKKAAPIEEKKPPVVIVQPVAKPAPPAAAVIVAPSITKGAAELDKRSIKSEQAVYFESDSLVLTLYDNGEVDGDTVTVVMNGNIIFSKQGLSTKANTKTIYIPKETDSVKLVMYAENLGEIPPNTGLMVVMDGEKRYDVRFSADLQSNSAIVLRRKKKE
jgi:hypothetical protein